MPTPLAHPGSFKKLTNKEKQFKILNRSFFYYFNTGGTMEIFCKNCKKTFEVNRDNTVIECEHSRNRTILTVKFTCPDCGEVSSYTYAYRIPNERSRDF